MNIKQIHRKYKVEPINQGIYRLATKIWSKLVQYTGELTEKTEAEDRNYPNNTGRRWWRRVSSHIHGDEPQPLCC